MPNPPDFEEAELGQTPEERILAYTIGTPEVLASSIALAEYDPEWPLLYEREAARVRSVLGDQVLLR